MNIVVVIPCHNQDEIVALNIDRLLNYQTVPPTSIIVVDDQSKSFNIKENDKVKVIHTAVNGRSSTRNYGIKTALDIGADLVIFMDGDTVAENDNFIENYLELYPAENPWPKFVFGTRRHVARPLPGHIGRYFSIKDIDYPSVTVTKYPSDLLTGNMDSIIADKPISIKDLDPRDLRIICGIADEFNKLNADEKIDMIISGMITWSCNFAVNKHALYQLRSHNMMVHGREFWFDDNDFNTGWGYEDVALGLDAMFAGVDVMMTKASDILHFVHNRSDELGTHVVGRHKIMDRYRKLYKNRILNAIREIK